jgi:hypothetical protein
MDQALKRTWRPFLLAALTLIVAAMVAGMPAGSGVYRAARTRTPGARRGTISEAAKLAVARGLGAADPGYWARPAAAGLAATNAAQHLTARFGRGRVVVRDAAGWVGLSARTVGRSSAAVTLRAASPHATSNRVTYTRPGLEEWYANGALGLEQGMTIAARPEGTGPLTVGYELTGSLRPRLTGNAIQLDGPDGIAALRYGGLSATDAGGRSLPTRLRLDGRTVSLVVDDRGATYPLQIDPLLQEAKLTIGAGLEELGWAIAMSGNTIAAGAPLYPGDGTKIGAVYVFTEPAGGWADMTSPTARLTDSSAGALDHLGQSVGISGNTVVAGAHGNGKAIVWVAPDGGWADTSTPTATLTDSAISGNTGFGSAVAIDGTTVVVGDPANSGAGGGAFVYEMPGGGWASSDTPTAVLGNTSGDVDSEGASVAISGDTIVAGSPTGRVNTVQVGVVDLYVRPGATWASATMIDPTAVLTPSGPPATNIALGTSVATDGDTVVAGAPYWQNDSSTQVGAAYVYQRPAGGWTDATQTITLAASDGTTGDLFGWSVGVSGSTIAVGDPESYVPGGQGAVFLFQRPGADWSAASQTQKLTANDNVANLDLGYAVAIDAGTVAGSADASQDGRAYVFGSQNPTITTASLPAGSVGVAYDTTVQVSGGTAPYQWSATGLPTGLSINQASGEITGKPTGAAAGYTPTIMVTDAHSNSDSKQLGLTIGPAPPSVKLTIKITGDGAGFVEPGSTFTCYHLSTNTAPNQCTTTWPYGSVVDVHATPVGKSSFLGWFVPGICITITDDCIVTMNGNQTVTANFTLPPTLTVSMTGVGTGTVTETTSVIAPVVTCSKGTFGVTPPPCNHPYPIDSQVTLRAKATQGSVFTGFSGSCAGTGPCTLTMITGKAVAANFSYDPGVQVNAIEVTQGVQTSELPTRSAVNPSGFRVGYTGVGEQWQNPGDPPVTVKFAQGHATVARVYVNTRAPLNGIALPTLLLHAYRGGHELPDSPIGPDVLPAAADVVAGPLGGGDNTKYVLRYDPYGAYTFALPYDWTSGDLELIADANTAPSAFPNCATVCQEKGIIIDGLHFNPVTSAQIVPIAFCSDNAAGTCIAPNGFPGVDPAWYETQAVTPFPIYINKYQAQFDATGNINPSNAANFNYQAAGSTMLAAVQKWADANDTKSSQYPFGVVVSGTQYSGGVTAPGGGLYGDGQPRSVASDDRPLTALAHEFNHGLTLQHAGVQCGSGSDPGQDGQPATATGTTTKNSTQLTGLTFSAGTLGGLVPGEVITGPGLAKRTLVVNTNGGVITMTKTAGSNNAGATYTFASDDIGQVGESWPPASVDPFGISVDGLLDGVGLDTNSAPPYRIMHWTAAHPVYDLMSYCGAYNDLALSPDHWISVRNWNRDVEFRAPGATSRAPYAVVVPPYQTSPAANAAGAKSLAITAVEDLLSNTATIESIDDDSGASTPVTGGSAYTFVARDAHGTVIATAGGIASVGHVDGASPVMVIQGKLPATGVREISVTYNGNSIGTASASPSAPTVVITAPAKGARVGGTKGAVLRWASHDADGNRLTATVRYSADGGTTWRTIYSGPDRSSTTLPSGLLSASRKARVRVYISDGFNEGIATSPQFIAVGAPPVVSITSPRSGLRLLTGSPLGLTGVAFDDTGARLSGGKLTWTAGRQVLGHGAAISPSTLMAGRHTITLTARDRTGRTAHASIVVTVLPSPPTLLVLRVPHRISAHARSFKLKLSTLAPATLTIGHTRAVTGRHSRTVKVKVKPGKKTLELLLVLRSGSYTIRVPLTILR